MAVGKITSPSSWTTGTVASSSWFNNAQDSLNAIHEGMVGSDYYLHSAEFDGPVVTVTATSTALVCGWMSGTTMTNATITNDNVALGVYVGGGIYGALLFRATADVNPSSINAHFGTYLGLGTRNFWFRFRALIQNRSKIETAANKGFFAGFRDTDTNKYTGFVVGSNEGNWRFINDDNTTTLDAGTSVTPDGWAEIEFIRLDGAMYAYVNGTVAPNVNGIANTTNYANASPRIFAAASASPGSAGYTFAAVDYAKILSVRA
jgi:hypothetical protein